MLGLIAGGLGAIGSVASSVLGAQDAKRAAKQEAERLAAQQAQNVQMVQSQSALERERALRMQKQAQWEMQQVTSLGKQSAARMAMAVFGSGAYQAQAGFLQDMFNNPIPESLAQDVSGRMRTAQAARGLTGYQASRDEANVLANMAFQSRQQMLPQMRQLAYDPMELQMGVRGQEQQLASGAQAYGLAGMQAQMQALQAGQGMAAQQYGPLIQSGTALAGQTPTYGGSALASGLAGLSGALPGLGQAFSSYQAANTQASQFDRLMALIQQKQESGKG